MGRIRHVGRIGPERLRHLRQNLMEQLVPPLRRRTARHDGRLRRFLAAAQHREARVRGRVVQDLARLCPGFLEEGVVGRIIEPGEHEVLPDQEAQFVAGLEERQSVFTGLDPVSHAVPLPGIWDRLRAAGCVASRKNRVDGRVQPGLDGRCWFCG